MASDTSPFVYNSANKSYYYKHGKSITIIPVLTNHLGINGSVGKAKNSLRRTCRKRSPHPLVLRSGSLPLVPVPG